MTGSPQRHLHRRTTPVLLAEIERGIAEHGLSATEAIRQTAQRYGLPRRQVYQQWLRHRAVAPRGA
ncbi:hypothetical protein [Chloracidobacterium aggregatum]|uniref:hypothetical protein n=1 Tax=Chloracidobacterium aggregatum TaxID=2851959 RepID=UPI001FE71FC9|nr:hypothetical protein [Chloracidobacterium aggregatum]